MFGFHFSETMQGTWTRDGQAPGQEERPIAFSIVVRARSWLKHLRDHDAEIEGTLRMDGFAKEVPVRGTLHINPLMGKVIRYDFGFLADDGRRYRFIGQKDVSLSDVVGTMTTLPAAIEDENGKVVARCHMKFDTKDLPSFLASFRPA
jgi:hypothetical protein